MEKHREKRKAGKKWVHFQRHISILWIDNRSKWMQKGKSMQKRYTRHYRWPKWMEQWYNCSDALVNNKHYIFKIQKHIHFDSAMAHFFLLFASLHHFFLYHSVLGSHTFPLQISSRVIITIGTWQVINLHNIWKIEKKQTTQHSI